MEKFYTSLGLMSGTSMDGIDASIIRSDGENEYESTFDEFFEYDQALYKDLVNLRNKINSANDIIVNSELVSEIERKITLYHAEICNKIINKSDHEVDLIGFHGQTIFHDASQKISKQLGDGSLLSSLLKKDVIYNFRANDIANGGQGAPLAPIFHNLIINKNKIELPVFILNIGGIANITIITSNKNDDLISYDIGPGNCLLDEWVRKHTSYRYDLNGKAASIGKIVIRTIAESNTQLAELFSGGIDWIWKVKPDQAQRVEAQGNFTVKNSTSYKGKFYCSNLLYYTFLKNSDRKKVASRSKSPALYVFEGSKKFTK